MSAAAGSPTVDRRAGPRGSPKVLVLATGRTVVRRGGGRRLATALTAALVVAGAISALSVLGHAPPRHEASPMVLARRDAQSFVARYVAPDGRVVRRDQGGTTVSEGQGYALLLAVALGDRATFARVWEWERRHLQLHDGLFAYLWRDGSVANSSPATDADLDTAWALVLAGKRFGDPAYSSAGSRVAASVLADETVTVRAPPRAPLPGAKPQASLPAGSVELAAGPWARTAPFEVNPSYLAPEAMAGLATLTGGKVWGEIESDSLTLLQSLQRDDRSHLPPDWATVSSTGSAEPSASSTEARPTYGLTAERVAVWYAADCSSPGRAVAASMWPTMERLRSNGGRSAYSLDGVAQGRTVNPLGYVAAAAAADAAGHRKVASRLLARADRENRTYHSYYGGAWVALGRVLLDTTWLSPCPPS